MPKLTSVRKRLYWEYAKLMATSATGAHRGNKFWRFAQTFYKKLLAGEMQISSLTRDNKKLVRRLRTCSYCSAPGRLEWEHIVPKALGGPDSIDNLVESCGPCNRSKGAKDLLAWRAANEVSQEVMSKYLKLLVTEHNRAGTLDDPSFPSDLPLALEHLHLIFMSNEPTRDLTGV